MPDKQQQSQSSRMIAVSASGELMQFDCVYAGVGLLRRAQRDRVPHGSRSVITGCSCTPWRKRRQNCRYCSSRAASQSFYPAKSGFFTLPQAKGLALKALHGQSLCCASCISQVAAIAALPCAADDVPQLPGNERFCCLAPRCPLNHYKAHVSHPRPNLVAKPPRID